MAASDIERWRDATRSRPLNRLLGIHAEERGEGFTQYRVVPVEATNDGLDGAEPGRGVSTFAITTAVDSALVEATSSTVDPSKEAMNGTAELNLTFVAHPRGAVTLRAEVVHRGPSLRVATVDITDEHGQRVAFCRSTYAVRPVRPSSDA